MWGLCCSTLRALATVPTTRLPPAPILKPLPLSSPFFSFPFLLSFPLLCPPFTFSSPYLLSSMPPPHLHLLISFLSFSLHPPTPHPLVLSVEDVEPPGPLLLPVVPGSGHLVLLRQLGLAADLLQRVVLQQGAVLKHRHQQVLRRRRRRPSRPCIREEPLSNTVTRRSRGGGEETVKTIRSPFSFLSIHVPELQSS